MQYKMLRTNIYTFTVFAWITFLASLVAAVFTIINPSWLDGVKFLNTWPSVAVAAAFVFVGSGAAIKILGLADFLKLMLSIHDHQKKVREIFSK